MMPDWLVCPVPASATDPQEMPQDGSGIVLSVKPGHELEIPAGALPPGTRVTLNVLEDTKPGVEIVVDPPVNRLSRPATLTITYRECEPKGTPARYRIRRKVPGESDKWTEVGGKPGKVERTISAPLPSFSTYALAAN
jgi:hypothetical protein